MESELQGGNDITSVSSAIKIRREENEVFPTGMDIAIAREVWQGTTSIE